MSIMTKNQTIINVEREGERDIVVQVSSYSSKPLPNKMRLYGLIDKSKTNCNGNINGSNQNCSMEHTHITRTPMHLLAF